MGTSVYDPEQKDQDSDLSPFNSPDLQDLERDINSRYSDIEREESDLKRLDQSLEGDDEPLTGSKLADAEENEADDDEDEDEADVAESTALAPSMAQPEQDFFVGGDAKGGGGFLKKKGTKMLIATGVTGLVLAFGSIFGFLNTFRLKHLMENVNFHAFNRYNAAVSKRSDQWVKAYTKIRMMEWQGHANPDGDGNMYFRANKIDTNNPVRDWYRTMRLSKFEDDLWKNQGIRFQSVIGEDGKIRPGKIQVNTDEFDVLREDGKDGVVLQDLPGSEIDRYANLIDTDLKQVFDDETGGNKSARLAIRNAVDKETRKWQVLKRRHIRKGIANMTGVRDWRFFDKTRTKVENKKNEFKSKMIKKIFRSDDSRAANFLMCALGLGGCTRSTDPSNPENINGTLDPSTRQDPGSEQAVEDGVPQVDADGNPIMEPIDGSDISNADRASREAAQEAADLLASTDVDIPEGDINKSMMEKITKQFTNVVGGGPPGYTQVKKVLDWTLKFNSNLKKGPNGSSKIGDSIKMARLTGGLMVAYAAVGVISDQMQSGEVDPDQVNAAMQYFDGGSGSEAFSFIMEGQEFPDGVKQTRTNADGTVEKVDKCSTGEPFTKDDLVPFCDNLKPNGGSKLNGIEDAWNSYVTDSPLGTLLDAYQELKNKAGWAFGILDKFGDAFGSVISAILKPIMSALGLDDLIGSVVGWLSQKLLAFIGVKPCMTGAEDSGGMAVNCLAGGAAGSAETAIRSAGGVLTAVGSIGYNYSAQLAIDYNRDTYNSMSTYDKYFALDNHLSLTSNLAFNMSLDSNPLVSLGNIFSVNKNFGKGFSGLASVFSGKAYAADENAGFRDVSPWAGVDTYSIPQECIDLDPLDPDYLQKATNNPNVAKDIETLGKSDNYSKALYSKSGDLSEGDLNNINNSYNCVALDNQVRGSLGGVYGYSNDDGYDSSEPASTAPTTSTSTNSAIDPSATGLRDPNSGKHTYVFPLAPQTKSVGGITAGLTSLKRLDGTEYIHGDQTAAFDLKSHISGADVYAITSGKVDFIDSNFNDEAGCVGLSLHADDGFWYAYNHLMNPAVTAGTKVTAGQKLGQLADTASHTSDCYGGTPHLHIDRGCMKDGKPQTAGSGDCRDPDFIPFLSKLYEELPD